MPESSTPDAIDDLGDRLTSMAVAARAQTGADHAAVGLLGPDGTLVDFRFAGLDPVLASGLGPLPTGIGLLGIALSSGSPVRLEDVTVAEHASPLPAGHPPVGPFLSVPIADTEDDGGRTVGHLYVTRQPGREPFQEADERVLVALAHWAASSVAESRRSARGADRRTGERVKFLLEHLSDAVLLVDMGSVVTYAAGGVEPVLGRSPVDVVGCRWPELLAPEDRSAARHMVTDAARHGTRSGELRVLLPDGGTREVDIAVNATSQADHGLVVTLHDATERHVLQTHLVDQAFHDPLTGLANRALFRERLGSARAGARSTSRSFVVMFLDLDDFKNVNDSLGHPAGDMLLRHVGRRIDECIREEDTAARTGGDEFAVLLQDKVSVDEGAEVARRILDAVRQPLAVGGTEIVCNATIGLVVGDGGSDVDELERSADLALYEAKRLGKGRFAFYEPALHEGAMAHMTLVNELRGALARSEFVPWFQPVRALDGSGIAGLECLARWNHPTRGLLGPEEFLAAVESTGLIEQVGLVVMRLALASLAGWRETVPAFADLRLTVNVSPRQLLSGTFVEQVRQELALAGVPADQLVLEITESALLPDLDTAGMRMRALAELGVSIYLDDFGTGWSSLRSLRNLPFDGLKLAGEFVAGLPGRVEVGVAQAIRDLAAAVGVSGLVAEGIETPEQRRALLALGYRLGQGYLLGRPMPGPDVPALLLDSAPVAWAEPDPLRPASSDLDR